MEANKCIDMELKVKQVTKKLYSSQKVLVVKESEFILT